MTLNAFDFINRARMYNVINLQYKFKINDVHYPDVETV